MSVLIKGMKMPQKCSECLLAKLSPTGESLICNPMLFRVPWDERPSDCPLIELPDEEGERDKWWERNETVNVMAKLRAYESGKRSANRSMERSEE